MPVSFGGIISAERLSFCDAKQAERRRADCLQVNRPQAAHLQQPRQPTFAKRRRGCGWPSVLCSLKSFLETCQNMNVSAGC
jgi:hypothetical protein